MVLGAGIESCSILNALIWGQKTIELYSMDKNKAVLGTIWEGVPCLQRLCERASLLIAKNVEKRQKTRFLQVEYSHVSF